MLKRIFLLILSVALTASLSMPPRPVYAQQGKQIRIIRDAEIENIIRAYATPLFTAAGLDPSGVQVHLVQDRSLNAFVAVGQHIFINTGLLIAAKHPGQVIGVIAHETGHIVGGHLARMDQALANAQATSIISFVLGAAAAIVAGRSDAAVAVIGAGQGTALRSLLSYTRTQETAADQFAVDVLDKTGQSASGMEEFLMTLGNQEFLVTARQDPYVRTHPITQSRIDFVRHHVANSPYSDAPVPEGFKTMQRRMHAKLIGFLEPPRRVLTVYKESDNSLESRYARAIVYHREAKLDKSLALVDSLLADHPDDPYFHELRGQILFESGRPADAQASYERAVQLLPNEALLRTALGAAQLESQDSNQVKPALANLKQSARLEPDSPYTWRLLATAYGRLGDRGMTALSLAEESLILNRKPEAKRHAEQAMELLKRGSPPWLRAEDIARALRGGTDEAQPNQ